MTSLLSKQRDYPFLKHIITGEKKVFGVNFPRKSQYIDVDEYPKPKSKTEAEMNSKEMYSYGSPHMAVQKQDDQPERTFSSYVRIQDVVLKTYLGR